MVDILFGLGLMGMGIAMIIWATKFTEIIPFEFGARITGGSSSMAYQLLGVILVMLSFFFIFGFLKIFG